MNKPQRTPEEHETWLRKIERHIQSAFLGLISAGIIWALGSLVELKTTSAANHEHLENIDIQLSGAYRATDAKRDMAELKGSLSAAVDINAQQQLLIELNSKRITTLEEQRRIEWARSHPYAMKPLTSSGGPKQPNG